jgi:ABC-2 type transport system permease protein
MNRPFYQLIALQFKEYLREPEAIFWSLIFPVVMAFALGLAFDNTKAPQLKVGVLPGAQPAQVVSWLPKNGFVFVPMQKADAILAVKRGLINLFLEPQGGDAVVYHVDLQNPEGRSTYMLLEQAALSRGRPSPNRVQALVVQGTRYIDFLIPGLLAMGIMSSCLWGIGWGLIEIRQKKLLRRMVATPMNKTVYMASHLVTRLALSVLEFMFVSGFAMIFFHMRLQGSWLALALVFLSGNVAFFGVAVLMASRTGNSRVGNGLINAVSMPMMLLSGVFFSYQHFPDWAIPVIRIFPLTLIADCLRAIFNEGQHLLAVLPASAVLIVLGIVCFGAGMRVFKWF